MAISNYQLSLNNAVWIDVNSKFTQDTLPDRLPDGLAIVHASLFNLFNCRPGERARIFQPEYGSLWAQFIHEPMSDVTAAKMEIFMIDSLAKWEPRIILDLANTRIDADTTLPGYVVRLVFSLPHSIGSQQIQFQVSA